MEKPIFVQLFIFSIPLFPLKLSRFSSLPHGIDCSWTWERYRNQSPVTTIIPLCAFSLTYAIQTLRMIKWLASTWMLWPVQLSGTVNHRTKFSAATVQGVSGMMSFDPNRSQLWFLGCLLFQNTWLHIYCTVTKMASRLDNTDNAVVYLIVLRAKFTTQISFKII